jgi:hypothetical protein
MSDSLSKTAGLTNTPHRSLMSSEEDIIVQRRVKIAAGICAAPP